MKIACSSCKKPVPSQGLDLKALRTRCPHCDASEAFPELPLPCLGDDAATMTALSDQAPAFKAVRWHEQADGAGYCIVIPASRRARMIAVLLAALWVATALVWRFGPEEVAGGEVLFYLVIFGVMAAGHVVFTLNNRAVLRLDPTHLVLEHKPIPYPGALSLDTINIEGFSRITDPQADSRSLVAARTRHGDEVHLKMGMTSAEDTAQASWRLNHLLLQLRGRCPGCKGPAHARNEAARWGLCRRCEEVFRLPPRTTDELRAG